MKSKNLYLFIFLENYKEMGPPQSSQKKKKKKKANKNARLGIGGSPL
jgi:hypothetical protein